MTITKQIIDGTTVVVYDDGVGDNDIEIDYTEFYTDIVAHLKTLADNSTAIKNDIAAIKTNIETIANLADGTGVHVVHPYEWEGGSVSYRSFRIYPEGVTPPEGEEERLRTVYGVENVTAPSG